MKKLRCVIVEDQVMFLELLATTLRMIPAIEVVATASDAEAGRAAIARHRPDMAIIDRLLPRGCGLEVAALASSEVPGITCLLLTAQPGDIDEKRMRDAGIRSVIDKVRAFDVLMQEIEAIHREKFPGQVSGMGKNPEASLTPREREVFHLVGEGLINKQIADRLFISQRTVESHRKAIARKLRTSGSELVRLAAISGTRHDPDKRKP